MGTSVLYSKYQKTVVRCMGEWLIDSFKWFLGLNDPKIEYPFSTSYLSTLPNFLPNRVTKFPAVQHGHSIDIGL
jgi:hypothetical protein